jgi:hypothetical protein
MRFMAPPTLLHRLARNAVLRGSARSSALRRRVDSGKLAEPAGRLLPAGVEATPLRHGFAVARIDHDDVLVRPDGYLAPASEGDPERTLERWLKHGAVPADR